MNNAPKLLVLFVAAALLAAARPAAAEQRFFAYEYTRQSGNLIDFYNLTNATQVVTVDVYNPDGTLNGTRTLTLRGYESLVRVDGDEQILKSLLAAGIPVVVETWFVPEPGDEMGHYRVLIGYSDAALHEELHRRRRAAGLGSGE